MSWPNDLVLEFLELYRQQPAIWNPEHPSYKSKSDVIAAWKNIQSSFSINCSIIDLKRKKESVMVTFRSCYKKRRKNPNCKISWFAYDFMESFLSAIYVKDRDDDLKTEDLQNTEYNESIDEPKCNANTREQSNTTYDSPPKIKKTKISTRHRSSVEDATIYSKNKLSYNDDDFDECDLYCQLLAKKLKKLNEHQREVAMHEIYNIMFRVKMDGAQMQCRNYPTSSSPNPIKIKSPVFVVTEESDDQYEDENVEYLEHSDQT